MNVCPYANESATCDLPPAEVDPGGKIAYCKQCSEIAFRCASGHWNRAFASYCTQCSQKLEKPEQWRMASANPQRTATLSHTPSVDSLNQDCRFGTWVVNTPEIKNNESLPGLLAIDGLIVVPNPAEDRLDAYTIANASDQRSPSLKWSIAFNKKLTYGSTPIYHGLHLFYVVSGGIQRKPVLDGDVVPVEIKNVDATQIEPVSGCAPLKCDIGGKPTMVVGLEQGVLLVDLTNNDANYIKHKFFSENKVMSPAQCGEHIIFTALQGKIFSLNTGISPYTTQFKGFGDISFSAPVALGEKVYFEALTNGGKRSLARFDPNSGQLSKATDLDNEPPHYLETRRSLFGHPLLTDGKRFFLCDRAGETIYTYDSVSGFFSGRSLQIGNSQNRFVPHQSIIVGNRIYSVHSAGLTILEPARNYNMQSKFLAMGEVDNPIPVARPIRYGDKLFILCKERLICRDY